MIHWKNKMLSMSILIIVFASATATDPVNPCPIGKPLSSPANCGRGGSPCQDGYYCEIHQGDAYAVCCLDCSTVLCAFLQCEKPVSVEGQCCPVCPENPGKCPAPQGVGTCVEMCSTDLDCPKDAKCCSNGCGSTCQAPLDCSTIQCSYPYCDLKPIVPDGECCPVCPEKPGVCPVPYSVGTCDESCTNDLECPKDTKCCSNGCGHTCQNPDKCAGFGCQEPICDNHYVPDGECCPICPKEKPGVCPASESSGKVCLTFFDQCYSDQECKGEQKCCLVAGCGRECVLPDKCAGVGCPKPGCEDHYVPDGECCPKCRIDKPGICPAPDSFGKVCAQIHHQCRDDQECDGEQKCCLAEGCGRECVLPGCDYKPYEEEEPNCVMPKDPGTDNGNTPTTRFYYDPLNCKCKKFKYGGCGGNSNNFKDKGTCLASCGNTTCPVCNLPKAVGQCKGFFPSYFFNIQTCQCEKFTYGGCGSNGNKYDTLEDCKAMCGSVQCPVCNLPPVKGGCKGKQERWYFDAADCTCKTFIYRGCGGNMNRFLTKEDCEGSCSSYPCPVCSMPKKEGPCDETERRFYYNPITNKCQKFNWGGCQPNGNNFKGKGVCNKVCKGFVCSLPKKAGPCEALKPRYFYDPSSGNCEKFNWGGCNSNGNNFKTFRACKKQCM